MKSKFLKRSAIAALSVAVLASSTPIAIIPAEAKTVSKINNKQDRSDGETADGLEYSVEGGEEDYSVTITGYHGSKTKIVIPEKIEGKQVRTIGDYAFSWNSNLEEIILTNSVKWIGQSAFEECSSLENITMSDNVKEIGKSAFEECSSLENITMSDNVEVIGKSAFNGCSSLKSITIPNSVERIDEAAFSRCGSLEKIEVAEGNPLYDSRDNCNAIIETETNMLIRGCEKTNIPDSVTTIEDGAFDGCSELESITIPENVRYIGSGVFTGCSSLKKIEVAEKNLVYDSRDNCNAIIKTETNTLIQGCEKTNIPDSVEEIGRHAFSDSGLTSIVIPESVTSIEIGAFSGCNNLESIVIPESVTSIEGWAFSRCNNLESIVILGNIDYIADQLFSGCYNLEWIKIPDSITFIGEFAFWGCEQLKDIYYMGSAEQWNSISIYDAYFPSSVNIHYNSTESCEISGHVGGKATCSQRAVCSVCGQEYGELDPTNHKFTNYISDNNATTEADGTKTAYCDYGCGTKDTIPDPGTKVPESETNRDTEKETKSEKKQESETNPNSQDKPQQKPEQTTLKKVAGVKVASKAKGRVNVSWKRVTGAKGYQVQYSQKKNFAGAKTMKVSGGKKVKAIVKKLKSKKTYYFRVRAIAGKTTGKWSAVKKVKKVK